AGVEPAAVVELAGALVTPAFVDAHVHTTSAGLALAGLDLSTVDSVAAVLDRASYGGVVYLSRVDMHSAAVSSALVAATPGVAGLPGYAESGHLTRDAHHAVRRAIWSGLTAGQRRDAQRATRRRAAELGIG